MIDITIGYGYTTYNIVQYTDLKGIVSVPTIFTYIIEWGSRTKNNILLSLSELDLTLKFSFLSQFSRNSHQWKVVTQSKTCQWKVGTNPKRVSENWLPNPKLVSEIWSPIQNMSVENGHPKKSMGTIFYWRDLDW